MENNAVVLFSGGFDSIVLLHEVMNRGQKPFLLFFDYGQKNRIQEMNNAHYWARKYQLEMGILELPSINSWSKAKMLRDNQVAGEEIDKADESIQYIEMRNLIFLAYASSIAESIGAIDIYTAIIDGCYADGNARFVKSFDSMLFSITDQKIQVVAPFALNSKDQVKDYAVNVLGLDLAEILAHSISCNLPDSDGFPCGKCGDCESIRKYEQEIIS
ncbi:QueC-like queuosine biosynthesis [Bacillus phage BCD7]|uniref:7-cyano-7-deazaguanine synthase n=1 Tax=Bacillus phage BCD7 TaxID=1136534 RepID=J9PUC5_9CAUD|nr:QueC-like queuosine biosynthesis [Bacillus phage BCD7]AEZ50472.1 putative ExsB [Bacillus phage BCD7]